MDYFQVDKGLFVIERRAARRTRATCAASLRTLTSESFGHLWDLSETGARVSLDNPPEAGATALLKWGSEKVMCSVVWTERDMCGLEFDHPVDPAVVEASTRMFGIVEQPVATVGNIPVGRKRSAMNASANRDDGTRPDLLATRSAPKPNP
uniref:PilZ domain-containing protein n=1 Tax=Altererythrobacter segetis TaxID=1104773 RepID=UPI00140DC5E3|nr:PilZ domain-containing protein [Altererythrobacter segetis]